MKKKSIRLLLTHLDRHDRRLLEERLAECLKPLAAELDFAASGKGALRQLNQAPYDLCVLDSGTRDVAMLRFLRELRGKCYRMPVIVLVRGDRHITGIEALRSGAKDYLIKSDLTPEGLAQMIRRVLHLEQRARMQKRTETDIQRAHRRNERYLVSLTSILFSVRRDGTVTHWNPVAEKTFGVPAGDVVNKSFSRLNIHWNLPALEKAMRKVFRKKPAVRLEDVRFRPPEGGMRILGFTLNPLSGLYGSQSEVLFLGADITDRRRETERLRRYTYELESANRKIEREKAKHEAFFESIGDGLVVTDRHGRIVLFNKQAASLFGWSGDREIGKRAAQLISLQDEKGKTVSEENQPTRKALTSGRKSVMVACCGDSEAGPVYFQITASPVLFNQRIEGAVTSYRDITREREIDKTKTEFISTVSHELRTPLTSIREGVAQVVEEILGPVSADQKEFLGIALEEVDRLSAIINDLLDISKIEAGKVVLKKTWGDLREVIEQVVHGYQAMMKGKSILLTSALPSETLEVFCDADKIKQVLTNLITNAYRFTSEGGSITLEVEEGKSEFLVRVRDTGIGISEENLPRLFNKFVQVGRTAGPGIKGTGLGLAISKSLVEMHGGQIGVESLQGKGSVFFFTLPKLKRDSVASENIQHGLGELVKKDSRLSVMILHLKARKEASDLPCRPQDILKQFAKAEQRGMLNGIGDIFLNGADECMVVLPGLDKVRAQSLGDTLKEKMLQAMHKRFGPGTLPFEIWTGLSAYPDDAESSETLLRKARHAEEETADPGERRSAARIHCRVPLTLIGKSGLVHVSESLDLGEGGMRLYGPAQAKTGALVELEIRLPVPDGLVTTRAIVVWTRLGDKGGGHLIGLRFLGMTPAMRHKIQDYVRQGGGHSDLRKSA